MRIVEETKLTSRILNELSKTVVGKDDIKEALVLALIAGGHVLIEGLPGTAKTTLVRTFAQVVGCEFKRIQLTPDIMPADITGFYLYSPNGAPRFIQGPIFANVILADELNRTSPRTQAALLEAMQEFQVTIEGRTYPLSKPYMVIATQLAYGSEGTYPMTEVQADRFMLSVWSDYATADEEKRVIATIDNIDSPNTERLATPEQILTLQEEAKKVHVSEKVVDYIINLVRIIRENPDVLLGPSLRASIALFKCSRALALMDGRDFVIPDDVKHLARASLQHRIRVKPDAEMEIIVPIGIINRALEQVPIPKLDI